MTPKTLREQYLSNMRNKNVTAISLNGFQLKGTLTQFDCSSLTLITTQYGSRSKEVLCANYIAIIPHTQPQKVSYQMLSDATTLQQNYLHLLEDTYVSCISINGFRLEGILIAYDEHDVIVATTRYGGGLKHVLVTSFSSIIPEE